MVEAPPYLFLALVSFAGGLGLLVIAFFVWFYLDKLTPGFLGRRFRKPSASEPSREQEIVRRVEAQALLLGEPLDVLPPGSTSGVGRAMSLTHDELIMELPTSALALHDLPGWAPTEIPDLESPTRQASIIVSSRQAQRDMPQPGDDPAMWGEVPAPVEKVWGIGGFHGDSNGIAGPPDPEPRSTWERLMEDE